MNGKDSSSSPRSSWDGSERHAGPHFVLLTFPDGRLILSTPSDLTEEHHQAIASLMKTWLQSDEPFPLVIGNCQVIMSTVQPQSVGIIRK